jgi:hypothetical protein
MGEFHPTMECFLGLFVHFSFLGTSPAQLHPTIRRQLTGSDVEMSQDEGQARLLRKVIGDSDLARR